MERSTNITRLPFPGTSSKQSPRPLAVLLGVCLLLPLYQSAAQLADGSDEQTGPTKNVVQALARSVRPSATAPAPDLARAPHHFGTSGFAIGRAQLAHLGTTPPLAGKPQFLGPAGDRQRAIDCLALAAWYEAGNDVESQHSVIQVVLNRVAHPNFPKSVCGVVFQGSQLSTGCQFTFTCDGSMLRRSPPPAAMARARALAAIALQGTSFPAVMQATHYHADYVQPWWSGHLVQLGKVGRHIFYSWPGKRGILAGRPSSLGEAALAQLVGPRPQLSAAQGNLRLEPAGTVTSPGPERPVAAETAPVALAPKPGSVTFLAIDRTSPSGRWAVSALATCASKTGCRILGYETQEQIARNSAIAGSTREKPVFLFIRDAATGIDLALWDCDKAPRPSASQCLPASGRELARLLRDSES